jgi:hypothetical protein
LTFNRFQGPFHPFQVCQSILSIPSRGLLTAYSATFNPFQALSGPLSIPSRAPRLCFQSLPGASEPPSNPFQVCVPLQLRFLSIPSMACQRRCDFQSLPARLQAFNPFQACPSMASLSPFNPFQEAMATNFQSLPGHARRLSISSRACAFPSLSGCFQSLPGHCVSGAFHPFQGHGASSERPFNPFQGAHLTVGFQSLPEPASRCLSIPSRACASRCLSIPSRCR